MDLISDCMVDRRTSGGGVVGAAGTDEEAGTEGPAGTAGMGGMARVQEGLVEDGLRFG